MFHSRARLPCAGLWPISFHKGVAVRRFIRIHVDEGRPGTAEILNVADNGEGTYRIFKNNVEGETTRDILDYDATAEFIKEFLEFE